jgi:acyl-CoA thioesterase I
MLIGRKTTPAVALTVLPLPFYSPLLRFAFFVFVSLVFFTGPRIASAAAASVPETKTIVFFGDSLTAGYGLESAATDAYPAVIQEKLNALNPPGNSSSSGVTWHVVNAGLSGETTAGGLRRVDWILRQPVDIFVLALGGNDGLRGIDPTLSEKNLQAIIDRVKTRYPAAKIILAGMMMPGFMGEDFVKAFSRMYPALADKNHVALVPFLLDRVGGHSELNQADGIHPTPTGHKIVAETVWSVLKTLL